LNQDDISTLEAQIDAINTAISGINGILATLGSTYLKLDTTNEASVSGDLDISVGGNDFKAVGLISCCATL